MRITFMTVSAPAVQYLMLAEERINALAPGALDLRIHYAVAEPAKAKAEKIVRDIGGADAVFLDLMGAPPAVVELVNRGCEACPGHIIPFGASAREYLRLGKFTADGMKASTNGKAPSMEMMKRMQTVAEALGKLMPGKMRDMRNYSLLMKYFQNATNDNLYAMLLLLLNEYGRMKGLPSAPPPQVPLPIALYTLPQMEPFESATDYKRTCAFSNALPNVLLLFSSYAYPTDTVSCVTAVRDALKPICNVYALGLSASFQEVEKNLRRLCGQIPGGISLILNCMPFRLAAGPMGGNVSLGIRFLEEMDVPYLHPFFITRRTKTDWENSVSGCTPSEVLLSIMLPELDGAVDTTPVGAMTEPKADAKFGVETYDLIPIEERLNHLSARVSRYLALRKKSNAEKRVAIICYNYPPGEANLFGGAFLDTFTSVSNILSAMKKEGYVVEQMSVDQLIDVFSAGKAVNLGDFETSWQDAIWYDAEEYHAPDEVTACFGTKPGDIMAEDGHFFIPGIRNGNLFIGLQPSRGVGDADEAAYHDRSLPPHHQYVAFYQWLRDEFQADAIIHVGTHGTLEFLKGKESGMSGACYPDRLVADLPHIYLYYCGNPSEAMIAKRRAAANLVSYQPPVFVESDLYDDYVELSSLLDSLRQAEAVSPESAADAHQMVMKKASEMAIAGDIEEIETELYRMQHSLIPKGLHVFGQGYSREEAGQYLAFLKRKMDGKRDADNMLTAAAEASMRNNEMQGLLHALCGGYNPAKLGGDVFRSPEVLPAGYNLYQFDPRLVPSKTAMERGMRIAENTLEAYRKEHGTYPTATAVILWGLETSRTQGETVGQILGYLGIRYAKDSHIWNQAFEPIPLEELGRPRIDVTINICGFFRDMFPMLIENLDDIFCALFDVDEPDELNYFKANANKRYGRLIDEGYDADEAKQIACARFFGPAAGEYGTDLTDIIGNKLWQEESELGLSFTASLRHVYSRRIHGRHITGLYEENLRCVEIVSQLRSDHEYEITDLDHYYEFLGGLAKSVELVKGRKVQMYVTDTTGNKPITEPVDKSIARGIRTRVLNPKWVDGMLAHKAHGAQKIADRFENVLGLAATTGAVDEWIYDALDQTYVQDENLRRRMTENNPHAYMRILEQMMEYSERGYWKATEEQLNRIRDIYIDMENELEGTI